MKGSQSQKIILYHRTKNLLIEEKVIANNIMNFFYGNKLGKLITNFLLKRKFISDIYSYIQKSRFSRRKILKFVNEYNINLDELEQPIKDYKCFNDFFIRSLKPNIRPIVLESNFLISPADSRLMTYYINKDTIIPVKGIKYTLEELFKDGGLVEPFIGGICMVFRLAPVDYHHFCYIDDGYHDKVHVIKGYYHSVNPIALSSGAAVFQQNYRQYTTLNTKNFDDVLYMEVGAMLVGRIVQLNPNGTEFRKGQEKGYFEFGGSTVILVFKPNVVEIDKDIFEYSAKKIETLVELGSVIGKKIVTTQEK